ncbi:GRIP and coiled-coil domain-containing protein 1 isoform X2 [Lonchura striata]|uniref:GRIP and coiled-coil domain-containing protein 1 n=2 Tax=Lonchura striata TaxID=40157 RepID=A0A218UAP9_9PASE|nr:GRIP and coiled-coil domain-containing protein 1 isoform X2 [Lonchura striata domestica]XP_021402044.1 GRIP and coiled-coil domain-containing protein 1 isoform X2 [Lonchura striata domestica]OWK50803.1 GRIP and coiled-coil domain-containing protein 1 [Lonchura striata domestica]
MEKFGMNFGGGPSRKELLETIETQKQQLLRFQARLKDVVQAYKSLLKEKEALEASLKVLSVSHDGDLAVPPPGAGDSPDDRSSEHSEDSAGTAAGADAAAGLTGAGGDEEDKPAGGASQRAEEPGGSEGGSPGEPERRLQQLKAQLATLTGALATVTREKSRMEASYQAERRQMKQELEEAAGRARDEAERRDAELRRLREQLAETRARLAAQQRERESEQADHGLMLRELQELLRAERAARRAAERAPGHEQHGRRLSHELEELRRELQDAREESGRADPRIRELQEEMAALKNHFQLQLVQEMKKTAQAEEQLRQRSQQEERRVAELEAQVSQVSELLGTYEKAKQRDQGTIQRLKDRIVQLDLENKTLAIAASSRSLGEVAVEEATLDVGALKEKMEKLQKLLQAAAGKGPAGPEAEEPREPEQPPGGGDGNGDKASGGHCQQELRQLKEEFERYKVRAQQVLKSKATKDTGLAKELEEAREQLAELQDKHALLQLAADETEKRHRQELEAKQQELSQLQQLHRQELERCQLQFRERALRLEEEMHKQRDRALAVLAEKDRELEQLRAPAPPHGPRSRPGDGGPGDAAGPGDAPGRDSSEILPQALQPCSGSEPTFFLYAEQLARKEVEIAALRKHKHRLEVQLHQLRGRALAEEDKHREEVAALRDEIQKNCRDKSREGANLEYLKNVVYRFLTLPDARGRQQTLTAILAILHFSPEEKLSIAKSSAHGSWWLHGKR